MNQDSNYISSSNKYADKIDISFSEFSLFNQCGHRHLIEKHLKIAEQEVTVHLFFGNAIHACIEKSLKDSIGLSKRIDLFKRMFAKDMLENMRDEPGFQSQLKEFLEQGEELLNLLSIEEMFKKYKIISVEEPLFEKIYDKYYFKGYIDLIAQDRETGRYVIIDWKTSSKKWNIKNKLKNRIFLCQLRFYKYFWSKKSNIPLDNIDCEYIVLSRGKSKSGEIQNVKVSSTKNQVFYSLKLLADTIDKIHIKNVFKKIKHTGSEFYGCMFCKFKGGKHPLCNSNPNQYKQLLMQNKNKNE